MINGLDCFWSINPTESSCNSSDYVVIITNEDDEYEEADNSKRRRRRDLEREVPGLREDNEKEVDEKEDDGNIGHPQKGICYCIHCVSLL